MGKGFCKYPGPIREPAPDEGLRQLVYLGVPGNAKEWIVLRKQGS